MKSLCKRAAAAVLCLLLLLSLCTAYAAADTAKTAAVSGMVAGEDGLGLVAQVVFTAEGFVRRVNTDLLGRYTLRLPLGRYTAEITRGSEYARGTLQIAVEDRKAKYLGAFTLRRLYDTGWLAGDLHQHSVYSFDGKNSPADIVLSDMAAGLSFGALTDHNDLRGNAEYLTAARYGFVPLAGVEVTTGRGHYNALGAAADVDYSVAGGAADIERIANDIHAQGALAQINPPTRTEFAFTDWTLAPLFDTLEVWNGKSVPPYVAGEPNAQAVQAWFQLLNDGMYLAATAGSDNHDIDGNLLFQPGADAAGDTYLWMTTMFSGMPRTVVCAAEQTADAVLEAIRAGHSFLTNNPLAFLTVDGHIPGETAQAGACAVQVTLLSNRALTQYRLIKNGVVWIAQAVSGMQYEAAQTAQLQPGDWVVLEVFGESGDYAISNPVFIE